MTRDYIRLVVEVITDNADDDVDAQEDDGGSELDSVGENFWVILENDNKLLLLFY